MAARSIAFVMLAVMLAIVAVFLWAVVRPPAPDFATTGSAFGPPVARENRVSGAAGSWTLYAWAVPGADRAVVVTVSARDLAERPIVSSAPPTAIARMLDMAMGAEPIALVQESAGFWRGSTRLTMAGRWSLQVDLNGEMLNLPFEVGTR